MMNFWWILFEICLRFGWDLFEIWLFCGRNLLDNRYTKRPGMPCVGALSTSGGCAALRAYICFRNFSRLRMSPSELNSSNLLVARIGYVAVRMSFWDEVFAADESNERNPFRANMMALIVLLEPLFDTKTNSTPWTHPNSATHASTMVIPVDCSPHSSPFHGSSTLPPIASISIP